MFRDRVSNCENIVGIMTDFEPASYNTAKEVQIIKINNWIKSFQIFPNCNTLLCYFHLTQSVTRHAVNEVKLRRELNGTPAMHKFEKASSRYT